jgi:hypothetical protein
VESAYYGLDSWKFHDWGYSIETDDSVLQNVFRFIQADENDGARWVAGDTIAAFGADWEHSEFKDNSEFVLAGSTTLAAGGVALLAAILM